MLVQSQNPEFFQIGKSNIANQKIIDSRGNANQMVAIDIDIWVGALMFLLVGVKVI